MSLFLYLSYAKDLSQDELMQIDKQVTKNRQIIYMSIIQVPSNSKQIVKHLFASTVLVITITKSLPANSSVPLPVQPLRETNVLSSVKHMKSYNHYKSFKTTRMIDLNIDNLILQNQKINNLESICYQLQNGSITMDQALLQLRGGGFGISELIIFILSLVMAKIIFSRVDAAFGQSRPAEIGYFSPDKLFKNSKPPQCYSQTYQSVFDQNTYAATQQQLMCSASPDNDGFLMTHQQAYDLISENYSGSLDITDKYTMSDWQTFKKSYHFQNQDGFGVNFEKYNNFSQDDVKELQKTKGGLIAYVRRGGKLAPTEFVKDCQTNIKNFCTDPLTESKEVIHFSRASGETLCKMFYRVDERKFVLFNETNGQFITSERPRPDTFSNIIKNGTVGSLK